MFDSELREQQRQLRDISYKIQSKINLHERELAALQKKYDNANGRVEEKIDSLLKNFNNDINNNVLKLKKVLSEILKTYEKDILQIEENILQNINEARIEFDDKYNEKLNELILFKGGI
ncbi:hypothetical protein MCANPG14_02296 [Mycoplasmopsis canis PG 14]|uniref:Uncharacterized protein n=1 Tax=Mycoplasmopsis canis TaxID=29555 RepID=A0A0F6X1R0_9BACT|nr:hypothetical protein [Mycoplasmopsis canis]AKF40964.1 hypothetical protein AAW50_00695 [Mycoplasmopsis canis]AMD81079.1 hypothetical protein AXW82_00670 [Mycoplasmopsis canis PG 14]EIE39862.1 hypothetical protein MCANPG14_02296 [Mycoplasmopsis canis PG 14]VEU68895.1 Uncharacterised protein [Mycoplasmopsis canis]